VDRKKKWLTAEQAEKVRQGIRALPDLTPDRMSRLELVAALSDRIFTLSRTKGYTQVQIAQIFKDVGITVSTHLISEMVTSHGILKDRELTD
jgi:hypothetical protein